jgi:hypothetical protein
MIRASEELVIVGLRDTGVKESYRERAECISVYLGKGDGVGVDRALCSLAGNSVVGDGRSVYEDRVLDEDGDGATRDTIIT